MRWRYQRDYLTGALDVDEVDVVRRGVHHCPERHGIGHLSMEPDVLVRGEQPSELGTDDADDVAEHGEEDKATIVSENETSAARSPDGKLETVQGSQLLVSELKKESQFAKTHSPEKPKNIPDCTTHRQTKNSGIRRTTH